jgi:ABC-type cobalamin transport system ATPase subunit
VPSSRDAIQEHSTCGDHTQDGICIEVLSKIVLAGKAVVLGAVDVAQTAKSAHRVSLGLGIVLLNVDAVGRLEALSLQSKKRKTPTSVSMSKMTTLTQRGLFDLQYGGLNTIALKIHLI